MTPWLLLKVFCWDSESCEWDRKRLNKQAQRASSVPNCPLNFIELFGDRRMLVKLISVMTSLLIPYITVGQLFNLSNAAAAFWVYVALKEA